MKFTGQNTVNRNFTEYSGLLTKYEIIKSMAYSRVCNADKEFLECYINYAVNNVFDELLVRDFNKSMNYKIRLFAPGLFQILWDGQIQFGDIDNNKK